MPAGWNWIWNSVEARRASVPVIYPTYIPMMLPELPRDVLIAERTTLPSLRRLMIGVREDSDE
eukprot:scaffold1950_cov143-Skeletonema_menzelii.AAC.2